MDSHRLKYNKNITIIKKLYIFVEIEIIKHEWDFEKHKQADNVHGSI